MLGIGPVSDEQSAFSSIVRGMGMPKGRLICMLWCYLDDSGTDREAPVVSIAGFVSPAGGWEWFEQQSRKLFKRQKLKVFTAKDFHNTRNEFEGWTVKRKRKFAEDWLGIARQCVLRGVTISIPKAIYDARRKEYDVNHNISAYGAAFAHACIKLQQDPAVRPPWEAEGMAFFVEDGSLNNGSILTWYENERRDPSKARILKGLSFVGKESSRAIQLADYLAFYSRRISTHVHLHDAVPEDRFYMDVALKAVRIIPVLADDVVINPSWSASRASRRNGDPPVS